MTTPTESDRAASARILVVDDDSLVAMGLVAMLEDMGHDVLEANSGEQALAAVGDDAGIDLVITDQSMPGMSGTDLARRIAELRPDLPVVLASGYRDVPEGAELNLPCLAKPFDDEAVAKLLSETLVRDANRDR